MDAKELEFGHLDLQEGHVLLIRCPPDTSSPECLREWEEVLTAVLTEKLGYCPPLLTVPANMDFSQARLPDGWIEAVADLVEARMLQRQRSQ